VQSDSGLDIAFAADPAGTQLLSWEIDSYSPVTGAAGFWVKVPLLSSTADTVIYLLYGNSAVSDFLGGATGSAWDSNYSAVYHFGDGTSVSALDSTGQNSSDLINGPAPIAGPIGGGIDFSSPTMGMSLSNAPSGDGPQTWEFWFRSPSTGWFFCEPAVQLVPHGIRNYRPGGELGAGGGSRPT